MPLSHFRPMLNSLDARAVPSVTPVGPPPDHYAPAHSATPADDSTSTAEETKRLTSAVLRVQDYVDGLLSIAASHLDQTTRRAVADGTTRFEGSKTIVFQPLTPPPSGGTPPGQGTPGQDPGTAAPPGGGGGFSNGLPGVTSGTVEINWKGAVRTKDGTSDVAYRVDIKAITDVTIEDTARPGRSYVVSAGHTISYLFRWTNRGGDVHYDTRGMVNKFQVTASEGGKTERLSFNAGFDIDLKTSKTAGDRVDVSFQTATFVRGDSGRHSIGMRIGITDTSAGRTLSAAHYMVDGRTVYPAYTANEI